MLHSHEIRSRFLDFFKKRKHSILASAPLVTEDNAGETNATLFNTAGMQPLIPYLLGKEHPEGKRLASSQKCVRTVDIDEVGDNTHASFFEMLGNWSLGDYFKKESIYWSWEFLTDEEEGLGLDPKRIYVTVFSGGFIDGKELPRDEESVQIWKDIFDKLGLDAEKRIFYKLKDNWWSAGDNSPSGTTTEIFYDLSNTHRDGLSQEEFEDFEDRQDIVEIWNNVFMEFVKENGKVIGELPSKNVDTGAGLERLTAVIQSVPSIYDTDLFLPLMELVLYSSENKNEKSARIVSDHIKTSFFIIADGVKPSNTKRGYVLRKLLRRAFAEMKKLSLSNENFFEEFFKRMKSMYDSVYRFNEEKFHPVAVIGEEWNRYQKILSRGKKIFEDIKEKGKKVDGSLLFYLEQTEGIPLELSQLFMEDFDIIPSSQYREQYEKEKKDHREKSKTAGAGLFKGGLADDTPKIRALHTATHLMLAGLRKYLGDHVSQKGSNITEERTRFDFTHPEKVSKEILQKVEDYVNDAIETNAKVHTELMKKEEARNSGVVGSFWEKYPEEVKVWTIKDEKGNIYSRELCGGPHVETLSDIAQFGKFKIKKEQSSSAGVRRIKAVIE